MPRAGDASLVGPRQAVVGQREANCIPLILCTARRVAGEKITLEFSVGGWNFCSHNNNIKEVRTTEQFLRDAWTRTFSFKNARRFLCM